MYKILRESTTIQIISFLRLKQAVFWSFAFPIFLYIVFLGIFGSFYDQNYASFLLMGILGMSTASDGLFAIGTIIKRYYQNGTLRILQKMPFNIIYYFVGVIISRFLILSALVVLLNIASLLINSYVMSFWALINTLIGLFIGLWIFGFLGLCINFVSMKHYSSEKGIQNIIYFLVIFTSNALYPVKSFNDSVAQMADLLPLNPILEIIRGGSFNIIAILAWSIIPPFMFYFLYKRIHFTR